MVDLIIALVVGAVIPVVGLLAQTKSNKLEKNKLQLEIDNEKQLKENLLLEKEALLSHNKELIIEKKETEMLLDRILDLEFVNKISDSVSRMFDSTKADRFLILVAKNGKTDFKVVSVVFEAHKHTKYRINAIARYRNVEIDDAYKALLKEVELKGVVILDTKKMGKHDVLKDFYSIEGVNFSKIRFLARKPINNNNDFLVFSSIATHESRKFTQKELAYIKTEFEGTIKPCIEKIFTQ